MRKFVLLIISGVMLLSGSILPQQTLENKRIPDAKAPEFKFIGYFFNKGVTSNIAPTNELLRGQIIGRLFGQNTTNTWAKTALYAEQRFVPMFIYTPSILDGYATFRGLFKIDMTWGDAAYGVGGNIGGAINAGQINLQTLMANVDIRPPEADYNVVLGLQRMFDNVRDPNITALGVFQTSAYKLAYWGTQGVGASLYANLTASTAMKFGYYQLYENAIQENDDVTLWMLDLESRVSPLLEAGADLWYTYDRGKSAGGISILGQGLNSALAEYNGATRLKIPVYEANVAWAGTHFSYNRDFLAGRIWSDGFVMTNFGNIDTLKPGSKNISIFGLAANAMVAYKYGMTANDKISVEGIFTTGDKDGVADGNVSSVITGNVYGSPTGIYSAHRALLLFPDPQVVNRYYSAVHDISNMGLGVTGGMLNLSKDFIPNKLSGKIGLASAVSNVTPKGGSSYMGTEVNMEVKYNLKVFLTLGLSAGYLKLGDFYNAYSATYEHSRPKDPWVIFTSLSWMMF